MQIVLNPQGSSTLSDTLAFKQTCLTHRAPSPGSAGNPLQSPDDLHLTISITQAQRSSQDLRQVRYVLSSTDIFLNQSFPRVDLSKLSEKILVTDSKLVANRLVDEEVNGFERTCSRKECFAPSMICLIFESPRNALCWKGNFECVSRIVMLA